MTYIGYKTITFEITISRQSCKTI